MLIGSAMVAVHVLKGDLVMEETRQWECLLEEGRKLWRSLPSFCFCS